MPATELRTPLDGAITPISIRFQVLRGADAFRDLAHVWSDVLRRIERPDFFHQYQWYDAMLDAWPDVAADTYFMVAYRGSDAIAICPLQLRLTPLHGIPVRTLAPPDPNDVAYPGFICAAADAGAVFGALLQHLRSQRKIHWDVLALPRIFADDHLIAELDAQPCVYSHARGVCYYYRADQGKEAINARMSSGLRKHLRWCRRQLSQLGDVEFITTSEPGQLEQLLDEFLDLEASGWKGAAGEGTAIKLDPALLEFYRGLLTRFGSTGHCEINLLRANGRNLAGQFCLISAGTWYHLKIAYDESYDKISPGSVLLDEVLTRLCADPAIDIASFLTGATWAERWHADELHVQRVIARNNTLAGHMFMLETKMRRVVRERMVPAVRNLRDRLLPRKK